MVQIIITPQAKKDFSKLQKKDQNKIQKRLSYLEHDIYAGKRLTGKYKDIFSLRAWPFRIFYLLQNNIIFITHIEHRQSAYKA